MSVFTRGDLLRHHGIKGQKWGVRRTPEELGHIKDKPPIKEVLEKSQARSTIVEDAIRSGEVSKKINKESQSKHTLDGRLPGRSYLYGDEEYAQKLIDELSGTGEPKVDRNGNWVHKEAVVHSDPVGVHIDAEGQETESRAAMIVYSKSGSHIYPRKDGKK